MRKPMLSGVSLALAVLGATSVLGAEATQTRKAKAAKPHAAPVVSKPIAAATTTPSTTQTTAAPQVAATAEAGPPAGSFLSGTRIQTAFGRRWLEDKDGNGVQVPVEGRISAHKQIPNFPISVGANFSFLNYRNEDIRITDDTDTETAWGYEVSPEVMAWIPKHVLGTQMVRPYVRANFVMVSNSTMDGNFNGTRAGMNEKQKGTFKQSGETTGTDYGFGAVFEMGDGINLLAEYVKGDRDFKIKKSSYTLAGQKLTTNGKKKIEFESEAIMAGVEVQL